jgi:hypothetical protein
MYTLVESVHVLTLCIFVGMSMPLDLRLLGLAFKRVSVSEVLEKLVPWMTAGFIVMVISGVLLFYAIPIRSYKSIFFRLKIVFLVLAGLNAYVFHRTIYRSVTKWDFDAVAPKRARAAGAASLILWGCIVVAGRLIAYNWFDCDLQPPPIVNWAAGCTVEDSQ